MTTRNAFGASQSSPTSQHYTCVALLWAVLEAACQIWGRKRAVANKSLFFQMIAMGIQPPSKDKAPLAFITEQVHLFGSMVIDAHGRRLQQLR